jgi:hypothetical protein
LSCWEEFFAGELSRLKDFYLIQISKEDCKEVEEWLRDTLESATVQSCVDKLRVMPTTELRQLRYDLVQLIKRIHRNKTSERLSKVQAVGAADELDERRTRDRKVE